MMGKEKRTDPCIHEQAFSQRSTTPAIGQGSNALLKGCLIPMTSVVGLCRSTNFIGQASVSVGIINKKELILTEGLSFGVGYVLGTLQQIVAADQDISLDKKTQEEKRNQSAWKDELSFLVEKKRKSVLCGRTYYKPLIKN